MYSVALDMEVKFAASSSSSGVKVESKKSVDNPRLALFERRAVELERKGWTRVLDSGDVPLMIDPKGNKFNLETGRYVTKNKTDDEEDDSWLQNLTSGRLRKKLENNSTTSTQTEEEGSRKEAKNTDTLKYLVKSVFFF